MRKTFLSALVGLTILASPALADPTWKRPSASTSRHFLGHLHVGSLRLQIWGIDGRRVIYNGARRVNSIKMGAVTRRKNNIRIVEFHSKNCHQQVLDIGAKHTWRPRKVFGKIVCYAEGRFLTAL